MPLIQYINKNFSGKSQGLIVKASEIIEEYRDQGFSLTLRQLYYQFVARDLVENTQRSYKRLGDVLNNARLAGYIDWNAIVDRTRNLKAVPHWPGPAEMVETCVEQFAIDKWEEQPCRVEVWIEKDALVGVIERVCKENDVPYFSCRGYNSQSEMWRASQRLKKYYEDDGQDPIILHLGDHDPSGKDMTRDTDDRLYLFTGPSEADDSMVKVKRIALNMDQIELYGPPPNPAKVTDSRARSYIEKYGHESWELDALEPSVMEELIQGEIDAVRDSQKWDEAVEEEEAQRGSLKLVSENWEYVMEGLENG